MVTNRSSLIDFIKAICIIFVIVSHSAIKINNIFSSLFIESAVPVFICISGFLFYRSYKNRKVSLSNWTIKKVLRFTIPFLMAFLIEIFVFYVVLKKDLNSNILMLFITGGMGKGSYYYPILIEFVLIYPLIYKIIEKYDKKGLLLFLVINLVYELIKSMINMDPNIYRLLVFRYIFIIAYGTYISKKSYKQDNIMSAIMFLAGLLFVIYYVILNNETYIFNQWTSTCMISSFVWLPILSYILHNANLKKNVICIIGESSYNIFLTQMIFYLFNVDKYIGFNEILNFVLSLLICIFVGIVFYKIENPITKKIIDKFN